MKRLTRCLLPLLLAVPTAAQRIDLFQSVDMTAKTTTFKFTANGPGGATCYLFAAGALTRGLATPFGTVYLEPATLVPFTSIALNAAGYGELRLTIPARDIATLTIDVQGLVVGGSGMPATTNYLAIGHYAGTTLSEILASRYDAATDKLAVTGKGRFGDLIEVYRRDPGAGWTRLATFTVPFAMMALGVSDVRFVPGGELEVRLNGIYTVLRMK